MASNVLVKLNTGGLLLLVGAANSLASRRDYEAINGFCQAPLFFAYSNELLEVQ